MSTFKVNIPAGPLWSNDMAQAVGPKVAAAHAGTFTGQWSTVVDTEMSVVEVELPVSRSGTHEFVTEVVAGPLWSNEEAQKVGPNIAASYGGVFTGQWRTITEGVMSVIQVKFLY
ncbi:mannan-binding lectin [Endothiovibrio diazotrophicus]